MAWNCCAWATSAAKCSRRPVPGDAAAGVTCVGAAGHVRARSVEVRRSQLSGPDVGGRPPLGQSLYLNATSLGLGPCGIEAFLDDQLKGRLGVVTWFPQLRVIMRDRGA